MTKCNRTVSFSIELDNVLGMLASASQQNLSEFLEIRLREHPEIKRVIETIRNTPEPVSMINNKNASSDKEKYQRRIGTNSLLGTAYQAVERSVA